MVIERGGDGSGKGAAMGKERADVPPGPEEDDAAPRPAGARILLFLAAAPEDDATGPVRDLAFDLASRADGPVLLLDLALPANRHFTDLARAGRLMPRTAPPEAGPPGHAVLHFHRVRDSRLHVSTVHPEPARFSPGTWELCADGAIGRLLRLFRSVVLHGPALSVSEGGLTLAPSCPGVVLLLRSGRSTVEAATALRDRVQAAGGVPLGTILAPQGARAA